MEEQEVVTRMESKILSIESKKRMSTEENKFTPSTIGNIEFSIPLYQRLFEWEEAQIKQLLFDLNESFKLNKEKPYYIGMLTVFVESDTKKYSLVDGQQRFTVLTLMALAFRKSGWRKFLKTDEEKRRLTFFARSEDSQYLENKINIIEEESSSTFEEVEKKYVNVKMEKGIDIINNFLESEIKEDERYSFIEYIYNNATFFISKLPSSYQLQDLNRYFESMNATGKGLENHEILKVELLKKVDVDKKEFYTKIWNAISSMDKCLIRQKIDKENIDSFRDRKMAALNNLDSSIFLSSYCNDLKRDLIEDNQKSIRNIAQNPQKPSIKILTKSERSILNFSEFLLQVLWLQLSDNIKTSKTDFFNTNKLLETFKLNLKEDDVQFFLDNLLKYRIIFDEFILRIRQDENVVTNYFINHHQDYDDKNNLVQYQSMLLVSTTINLWLSPLLIHLQSNHSNTSYSSLLIYLKNWDNERQKSFVNLDYGSIDRYWFWRLDYYLWENKNEFFTEDELEIAKKYIFKANRSIEHISPQNLIDGDKRLFDVKYLDTFGNLTMISGGQNSSLKNEAFQIKKAHVKSFIEGSRSGTIESLKMLDIYKYEIWDELSLKEHYIKMLQILLNSFDDNQDIQLNLEELKNNLLSDI